MTINKTSQDYNPC